jgi:hypothetical protein
MIGHQQDDRIPVTLVLSILSLSGRLHGGDGRPQL